MSKDFENPLIRFRKSKLKMKLLNSIVF